MVNRLIATGLLAILSLWLVACGTGGVGTTGNPTKDESHSGSGVWAGNYEVIRYNEAGFPDPSLNGTLQLALNNKGGQNALTISVRDNVNTNMVALDVHYSGDVHPADVKFYGALGSDSQVLSASFLTQVPGTAAIGQTGIGDYKPAAINGSFATVTFAPGALRSVSAAGDVHQNPTGVGYKVGEAPTNPIGDTTPEGYLSNVVVDDDQTAHAGSLDVAWYSAWHLADGNQNGQVEIADLSPLGKYLNQSVGSNFAALPADYDGNGIVAPSDLSKMGKHLNEGTDNYLVQVNDNDGSDTGLTTVGTYDWSQTVGQDWTAPTDPTNKTAPTPESLDPVFKKWTVHIDDQSAVTMQQLTDIDTAGNGDGKVAFHITPQRATQQGVTTVVEAQAGAAPPPVRFITVSQVSIRVTGATGGGDDGTLFDSSNTAGSVVANSAVHVAIDEISGTYSSPVGSGTFNSTDPLPADMTQQDYDDTLALIKTKGATGYVHFDVAQGGAPGFRYRSDWLTFAAAPPAFGDLGDGTIFPDDDPESTGATAEGVLTLNLDSAADLDGDPLRSIQFSSYSQIFNFDVTADPNAPILADPINLNDGQPVTQLTRNAGTEISQDITMPGTIQTPENVEYQLIEILPSGAAGDVLPFTYHSPPSNQGQFFVKGVAPASLQAFVTGILNPGSSYHFTFRDDQGGPWSSLNTPEPLLTTKPAPPPIDLVTVPNRLAFPSYAQFQIRMKDPYVRRDPKVVFDVIGPPPSINPPEATKVAYKDILKKYPGPEAGEIVLGIKDLESYPRITAIKADNPDGIDASTVNTDQFNIIDRAPDHVTVDCLGYAGWQDLVGEEKWSYKLFNADDSAFGQGTFMLESFRADDPPPMATASNSWGVNVYDRDNTPTASITDLVGLFNNRTLRHSMAGTDTPDVIWCEFNGGYMYDFNPDDGSNNVRLVFSYQDDTGSPEYVPADLRIAGITDTGDWLAIHVVTPDDYYKPGGFGQFVDGLTYVVHLQDSRFPGQWQSTYGDGTPDDPNLLFVSSN